MGGDKIVLLDGAGANGGGAATNGLLSMIPGMFANLIGGNKMDPNLVAALMNGLNQGLANNREQATSQFNILSAKLDAQTVMINDKFCQLEMREMQNTIAQLREEKAALTASALSQQQTQNIVGQLRPTAVPAYPSCSPYQAYTWGQVFGGGCCNNGCCNNNAAV